MFNVKMNAEGSQVYQLVDLIEPIIAHKLLNLIC